MKTYKIGDRVKTIQRGECTIIGIEHDASSPYMYDVRVDGAPEETESYTSDWKYRVDDAYPSLVEAERPHPIIIGKWMLVSDDKVNWKKRFVIKTTGSTRSGYLVFTNTENEEQLTDADDTTVFNFVKEIEIEPEEQISSHKQQIDKMFKNL